MSNKFYSFSLAETETLLLHHIVLSISAILSFIMLTWIVKRIKNDSKEKEFSMPTETRPKNLDFMFELPDEMIDKILLRLPEDSLMRFKSVSRVWNEKINSPSFVKSYGECKYSSMKVMLYTGEGESPIYSFPIYCREREEEALDNIPHNFGSSDYQVQGSCDGLLLVQVKHPDRLWIWNPSTRQYIDLPLPNYSNMNEFFFPRYGFGCVNSYGERNYKVLIIHESRESKLYVTYSTFKKSWRRIEEDIRYRVSSNSVALVNAKLHFNARNSNEKAVILSFDLEDEKFNEFPGPKWNFEDKKSLTELNGKLCIIDWGIDKKLNVWVMKEYGVQDSWTNMYCIDKTNMTYLGGSCQSARLLHFYVDGKILLHARFETIIEDMEDLENSDSEQENLRRKDFLVYYDFKNHTVVIPNLHGLPNIIHSYTYVETLISPNSISLC